MHQLHSASDWDVATRYHDFKQLLLRQKDAEIKVSDLRHLAVRGILKKAQKIIGSLVHPQKTRVSAWSGEEINLQEIDLDTTLENSILPWVKNSLRPEDIWLKIPYRDRYPVTLVVDTSLSMNGEKLALTAVSLAVVMLHFSRDPLAIVAFESRAKVIKRAQEELSLFQILERFLDLPSQGYTHLEGGLQEALKHQSWQGRPTATLLLSDGKYTAGKDPAYLAKRFKQLSVIKMGSEKSSRDLCQELAHGGGGELRELGHIEELPTVMYAVIKDLLRGKTRGALEIKR